MSGAPKRAAASTMQASMPIAQRQTTAREDNQQPSPVASRRLLPHDTVYDAGRSHLGTRPVGGKDEPSVLTGARRHELPAEVACAGCRRDQRQSGFSPETPVIPR
jgi:hypothetical protein